MQQRAPLAAPTLDLLEGVQHGPRIELDQRVDRGRQRALEYGDLRLASQCAQLPRFSRGCDEEPAATLAQQPAHDALDAEAVSIGLDDRGAVGGRRTVAEKSEIVRERVEIDAQRGGSRRISRPLGRPLSRHTAVDPL